MTTGAVIFMLLSWTFVLGLTAWSFAGLLGGKRRTALRDNMLRGFERLVVPVRPRRPAVPSRAAPGRQAQDGGRRGAGEGEPLAHYFGGGFGGPNCTAMNRAGDVPSAVTM